MDAFDILENLSYVDYDLIQAPASQAQQGRMPAWLMRSAAVFAVILTAAGTAHYVTRLRQLNPVTSQSSTVSSLMRQFSLEDLVEQSSLVVTGCVTQQSEAFLIQPVSGDTPGEFTDYTIEIQYVYRGSTDQSEVTVRVRNGQPWQVNHEGDTYLSTGEQVLLFLYKPHMGGNYNTEGEYYYITGLDQGVFTWSPGSPNLNGTTLTMDDCIGQIQSLSQQYPVDEYWLYHYNQRHTMEQLASGAITQEEYDEFWERMNEYAIIIN